MKLGKSITAALSIMDLMMVSKKHEAFQVRLHMTDPADMACSILCDVKHFLKVCGRGQKEPAM